MISELNIAVIYSVLHVFLFICFCVLFSERSDTSRRTNRENQTHSKKSQQANATNISMYRNDLPKG